MLFSGQNLKTDKSVEVLECLGIPGYSYHQTHDEAVHTNLLDLMEETCLESIDLDDVCPSLSDIFEDISEEVRNEDIKKVQTTLNDLRDTGYQFLSAPHLRVRREGDKENEKSSKNQPNKKAKRGRRNKKDVSSKICPVCEEKIEKENFGNHLMKRHSKEIGKYYDEPPNGLEVLSFKGNKETKDKQARKDRNRNIIKEDNPKNKCPICLAINIKRMSEHMRIRHSTLPAAVTERQVMVEIGNIDTFRTEISRSGVTLRRQEGGEGVYKVITVSESVKDYRGGDPEEDDSYQALLVCAICRSFERTGSEMTSHYSRVHFTEQLKAFIDSSGRCSLCGLWEASKESLLEHIGVSHNRVGRYIPRKVSVKFKKNIGRM